MRTIVRLPMYERSAKGVMSEAEERWIDVTLGEDPAAGATVAGTGGVRKLRVALPGRGKSGGARVIYYYRGTRETVYLLFAYPKNVSESLSEAGKREMQKLVTRLEEEP